MKYSDRHFHAALRVEIVLLIAPLFLIDYPPLADLPNHLARLFILSTQDSDPVLSHFWHSDWHLLPNLAIDAIGAVLFHLTSPQFAVRFILMLVVVLTLSGSVLLNRAITGRKSYWPLLAGLLVYNAIFLMGFLNFLLGVGVALHACAAWVAPSQRLRRYRLPLALAFTLLLFFCHIFSLAFYLLFIGSWQLGEVWRGERSVSTLIRQILPLLAPALLAVGLIVLAPHYHGEHVVLWSQSKQKIKFTLSPFINYFPAFDFLSATAFIAAFLWLLLKRRITLPPGVILFLVLGAAGFLICPMAWDNGGFLNARIPLLLWLVLIAGTTLGSPATRGESWAGYAAAMLFAVRLGVLCAVWLDAREDLGNFRALAANLPEGARVLDTAVMPEEYDTKDEFYARQPRAREVRGFAATYNHYVGYWVVEKRVFWPILFANENQQPVKTIAPYDRIAMPVGMTPDYRALAESPPSKETLAANPYLADWQHNFDYVVVLSAGQARHLNLLKRLPLTLVAKTDIAALYKINR